MSKYKCPFCDEEKTMVCDGRPRKNYFYRRRKCLNCKKRFSTYEIDDEKINEFIRMIINRAKRFIPRRKRKKKRGKNG